MDKLLGLKVRKYSEDETNLSLEFNEFLKLISAELKEDPTKDGNQILQALRFKKIEFLPQTLIF